LEVQAERPNRRRPGKITLVQAIPKGKLLEAIIQKATELGVWRIVPLLSQRVTTHLEGESHRTQGGEMAADRRGSDQAMRPALAAASGPAHDAAGLAGPRRKIRFDAGGVAARRQPASARVFPAGARRPLTLCVWIGPEGDFAPEEMEAIKGAGALPITIRPAGVAQRDIPRPCARWHPSSTTKSKGHRAIRTNCPQELGDTYDQVMRNLALLEKDCLYLRIIRKL
jgi:hypothetical protein